MTDHAQRTAHQVLTSLILVADKILARSTLAIDQIEPLAELSAEIERRFWRPADDVRVFTEAEMILCLALTRLAGGNDSDLDRARYRTAAVYALAMTRDHSFVAFEQSQRPTT